jgi:hypothetical protein
MRVMKASTNRYCRGEKKNEATTDIIEIVEKQ